MKSHEVLTLIEEITRNDGSKYIEISNMVQNGRAELAAERGFIDEVILPEETRKKLSESFFALKDKKEMKRTKKHGNIPL